MITTTNISDSQNIYTYPRSGSSNKGFFKVEKDNAVVKFRYKFIDNIVSVEVFDD